MIHGGDLVPPLALRKLAVGVYGTGDGYSATAFHVAVPHGHVDVPGAYWVRYPDGVGRKVQDLARARYFVRRHQETGR
jgi:hypothetical protein